MVNRIGVDSSANPFSSTFDGKLFWMVTMFTALVMVAEWCIHGERSTLSSKRLVPDLMYMYANIFLFAVLLDGLYTLFSMLLPSYGQFTTLGNAHWVFSWPYSLCCKTFYSGAFIEYYTQIRFYGDFIRFIILSKKWVCHPIFGIIG